MLYSVLMGTQSALHRGGESPQPSPVCSIHLDEVDVRFNVAAWDFLIQKLTEAPQM